jgi:hypothetical protein
MSSLPPMLIAILQRSPLADFLFLSSTQRWQQLK